MSQPDDKNPRKSGAQPPAKRASAADVKRLRLAEALRANLKRRKSAAVPAPKGEPPARND